MHSRFFFVTAVDYGCKFAHITNTIISKSRTRRTSKMSSSFFTPKKAARKGKAKSISAKRRLDFSESDDKQDAPADISMISPLRATAEPSITETPKKKARLDAKRKIIVTPDKEDTKPITPEEEKEYVPTYIHKNLSYHRRGKASLDSKTKKTFELIENYFTIPKDFEQSRRFGSLSGTCYEQRVIQAYALSLLKPTIDDNAGLEICSECATIGHKRFDCPTLI